MNAYKCIGGPFDGSIILLDYPGTLEFFCNGFKGYYDREMNWVNTNG